MKVSMDKETLQQHLQNSTDIVLIDVRSKDEFAERHIPNAIHIPIEMIEAGHFIPDSQKRIITVCARGGGRSERAAAFLRSHFPNDTFFLEGGTTGWFEN